jgi:hypothetical protein
MTKGWKWIIGIVIGLVVLAVLVSAGFAFRMHNAVGGLRGLRGWDDGLCRGFGMMPFGGMHRGGFGMMGGGPGLFFGGLLQIGFLVLLVLGIIWLVRKLQNPAPVAAPMAPAAPVTPPASCGKCGYPVQNEWKVCPNCGKKI